MKQHYSEYGSVIICNRKQGHYSDPIICKEMTLNEIHYNNPAISTYLSVVWERPSSRGDDSRRVKIRWNFFKIFYRTRRPNSIKLSTYYPWVKGIQLCSNKGPGLLQRGDNHKNVKMGWDHVKIFSRITLPEKLKFIWKRSDIVHVKMQVYQNHNPQGLGGSTIGGNVFTCVYIGKIRLKCSSKELLDERSWNLHESFLT
jgi:hypothetical protein